MEQAFIAVAVSMLGMVAAAFAISLTLRLHQEEAHNAETLLAGAVGRAVTLALLSIAPRFTPVAWGVLVGFIAVYLLGSLSGLPQWLLDL